MRWILSLLLLFQSPLQAYQAIIFDCDGVLVDTEGLKFTAWQKALNEQGVSFQEQDYLPLVGYSSKAIAEAIAKKAQHPLDGQLLIERKEAIYHQLQKQGVPIFKEAVLLLKESIKQREHGLKVAIASSAPKPEINENLRQLGVSVNDLDAIVSGKDDLTHIHDPAGVNKPKPYIYQLCLQKLQLQAKDAIVLEDSSAGVNAAFAAGLTVIALPNKWTQQQDFSHARKVTQIQHIKILSNPPFVAVSDK